MLHILTTAMNAVLPIVLLCLLGYFLKRMGFLSEQFAKNGSKVVFYVCLSSSLFVNVYNITDFSSVAWDVVIYCLCAIVLLFVLGLVSAILTTPVPARRAVILHGIFRSNFAIIGLSLAASLGGDEAMSVASVVSAFVIPLYNVLGVISLTMFTGGGEKRYSVKNFLLDIIKNPMILGAVAGGVCILLRGAQVMVFHKTVFTIKDHLPFLFETVNKLKTMTTPLALVVLGAQFTFSSVKGLWKEILVGTVWRLVLAPVLGIGLAVILTRYTGLLHCSAASYPALIAVFGSPVAVSSAVIAAEMGGDEQLATQLVVWTSIASVVTIYATVCVMMAMGLLAI